ncbi:MAG: hypothetical protein MUC43_02405 [Pirellula sp.]|jgi:hypothetical protein|nr:hypothetical protein [Pirellula sp.]
MSRKKTQPAAEPANRPIILGLLILAAGGYSCWYWYKPLPDLSQNVSLSPWDQDRTAEWNWTDAAVLRPTLEELQPVPPSQNATGADVAGSAISFGSSIENAPPPELRKTGSGLIAAPNIKWQLNTATQLEPPPKSPDIQIPDEAIVGTVKPWVDYDNIPQNTVADLDYQWPSRQQSGDESNNALTKNNPSTRAILSSGTLEQPAAPHHATSNQSLHRTESHRTESQGTTPLPSSSFGFGPPKLLDSTNKRIAIPNEDGSPPLPRSNAPTEFTAAPPRTPQYIRQPK